MIPLGLPRCVNDHVFEHPLSGKRSVKKTYIVGPILLIVLLSTSSFGATIRIPDEFPTIQAGINGASTADIVLVAPGTYGETIDFLGKAIAVRSEAGDELTVIDGAQAGSVVYFLSGEGDESVLEGFTIRNGIGVGDEGYGKGGGIYCEAASPTITGCTVTENEVDWSGGGIYCTWCSSPLITQCVISGNVADGNGGGVYVSAASAPVIEHCRISDNHAAGPGGGLYCYESSPTIVNCCIQENTAGGGGGIYLQESFATITNCRITGNSVFVYLFGSGGGIRVYDSVVTIANCLLWDNAGDFGGGIATAFSVTEITNCTITENRASLEGGGVHCNGATAMSSSILWGNEASFGPEVWGCPCDDIMFSDVEGQCEEGIGNIDGDPLFFDDTFFRLDAGSPCIDAGVPVTIYEDACLPPSSGTERNDMGAYGGRQSCGWLDFDGDGHDDEAYGGDDCDDGESDTFPGAVERCDGRDNDCDGALPDEELDEDEDGWMMCGGDCDDSESEINPGMEGLDCVQIPDNVDNDCDGRIDEDPCLQCFVVCL